MFASQETTPWYSSLAGLVVASIILPPVGIALLWMRRDTAPKMKILATLGIVILATGYVFAFRAWRKSSAHEAHYAALEQDRLRQQSLASAPASDAAASQT